jgi:hypothetical protein
VFVVVVVVVVEAFDISIYFFVGYTRI